MATVELKALSELPKLSCLQAKKRVVAEATEVWPEKRARLEKRKQQFVSVTAVNNFAKFVSFAAPSLESVERLYDASARSIAATTEECENVHNQIHAESEKLVDGLKDLKQAQDFIAHGKKRLEELPFVTKTSQRDLESEEQSLSKKLQELEAQATALEEQVQKRTEELENVKKEVASLSAEERQRKEERLAMKETEGPQRERLGLMASFVQVKKVIHEKLSGHHIVSITEGQKIRVALQEDDVTIDLEFDEDHKLVSATTSSIFTGTKVEGELRNKAIADNQPVTFVRGIKLLVHNANSLEKELEELRTRAKSSKKPFEVEFNPSKRILLAAFNRGSVYAKLRIPLDYTISNVELIQLERPESSRSLKPLVQQVQDALTARNAGKRVSDWVLELNDLL